MTNKVRIRSAVVSEQKALQALQLRASLNNPGDREALLANPDAIELPLEQIAADRVFVAERGGAIVDFQKCCLGNPHAKGSYTACGFKMNGTVGARFSVGLALIKPL